MVNAASQFISPKRNEWDLRTHEPSITEHKQPKAVQKAQATARKVRVRDYVTGRGYDAMGIVSIVAANDLTPITLAAVPPGLPEGDAYHYEMMLRRIVSIYDSRFAEI
jgi:hypothetical protein